MKYTSMRFADGEDRVSLLGFGCMRFPGEEGHIDEELAEKMLDRAIKAGVNYIDTAWSCFNGCSETFVGRALEKYPRDRFFLAAKLPLKEAANPEQAGEVFEKQLEYFHVKYIDYYLFDIADRECWKKLVKSGIIAWAEAQKADGKISHLGFSFHDGYGLFREIITYRQWDFCQFQYNYMDRNVLEGDRSYTLAEKMGIPVIVMNPVRGGSLADLPEGADRLFKEKAPGTSCASWALRWAGSHPNVRIILSGMSTSDQVEDNINTFQSFTPLSEEEKGIVDKTAEILKELEKGRGRAESAGCGSGESFNPGAVREAPAEMT